MRIIFFILTVSISGILVFLLFTFLSVRSEDQNKSIECKSSEDECPNDLLSSPEQHLELEDSNLKDSNLKQVLRTIVSNEKEENAKEVEATLHSEDFLNAEYSEYYSTFKELEDSKELTLESREAQEYNPYNFQQFLDLWNTGLEVKKQWNNFLYRKFILPTIIQNFMGFLPIRVPGLPYHIDPGSPDEYEYRPVNSIIDDHSLE